MNELTITEQANIADAIRFADLDEMKIIIAKLDGVKEALKKADAFRENSIRFAKLEAMALVRLCELGGAHYLRGNRRAAAEWLFNMEHGSRELYVELCENGLDIVNVWKQEVKQKLQIEKAMAYKQGAIEAYEQNGVVELDFFDNKIRDLCGTQYGVATDITQGLRRKLLRAGAVGVGYNSKIYLNPCFSVKSPEVAKAIANRVYCVAQDILSLKNLCETYMNCGEVKREKIQRSLVNDFIKGFETPIYHEANNVMDMLQQYFV